MTTETREKTPNEIKDEITERLNEAGCGEYWNSLCSEGVNEYVITAQRVGVDKVVDFLTE